MRHGFDDLVLFTVGLFTATGVPEDDARVTATRLVEADFRGRTGHGLIRAVPYLDRIVYRLYGLTEAEIAVVEASP